MNRGERIWKSLLNPIRHDVAATEWLLLYAVSGRRKATVQIQGKMTNLWKKINTIVPSFYLVYPNSNNEHNCASLSLEQELIRFNEIGIVQYNNDKWSLTENGVKTLKEWQPRIEQIVPLKKFKDMLL